MLEFCPLCEKNGLRKKVMLCQINLLEALWVCESAECVWPFGYEDFTYVPRRVGEELSSEWDLRKPLPPKSKEPIPISNELSLYTPPVTPSGEAPLKELMTTVNTSLTTTPTLSTRNTDVSNGLSRSSDCETRLSYSYASDCNNTESASRLGLDEDGRSIPNCENTKLDMRIIDDSKESKDNSKEMKVSVNSQSIFSCSDDESLECNEKADVSLKGGKALKDSFSGGKAITANHVERKSLNEIIDVRLGNTPEIEYSVEHKKQSLSTEHRNLTITNNVVSVDCNGMVHDQPNPIGSATSNTVQNVSDGREVPKVRRIQKTNFNLKRIIVKSDQSNLPVPKLIRRVDVTVSDSGADESSDRIIPGTSVTNDVLNSDQVIHTTAVLKPIGSSDHAVSSPFISESIRNSDPVISSPFVPELVHNSGRTISTASDSESVLNSDRVTTNISISESMSTSKEIIPSDSLPESLPKPDGMISSTSVSESVSNSYEVIPGTTVSESIPNTDKVARSTSVSESVTNTNKVVPSNSVSKSDEIIRSTTVQSIQDCDLQTSKNVMRLNLVNLNGNGITAENTEANHLKDPTMEIQTIKVDDVHQIILSYKVPTFSEGLTTGVIDQNIEDNRFEKNSKESPGSLRIRKDIFTGTDGKISERPVLKPIVKIDSLFKDNNGTQIGADAQKFSSRTVGDLCHQPIIENNVTNAQNVRSSLKVGSESLHIDKIGSMKTLKKATKRSLHRGKKYEGFSFSKIKKKSKMAETDNDFDNKNIVNDATSPGNVSTCSELSCSTVTGDLMKDSHHSSNVSNGNYVSPDSNSTTESVFNYAGNNISSTTAAILDRNKSFESNFDLTTMLDDMLVNESQNDCQTFDDDWLMSLLDEKN